MTHNADPSVLTGERIAQMRSAVLKEINRETTAQAKRRQRRSKFLLVAAAAVVAVLAVPSALSLLADVGTGQSSDSAGTSADISSDSGAVEELEPNDTDTAEQPDATADQVITTGSISMTTPGVDAAVDDLGAWVEKAGGRIDSQSQSGSGSSLEQRAHVQVRLPSDRVDDFTTHLRDLGTVSQIDLTRRDVGGTVRDLDGRIEALNISVDRLEKIMSEATSSKDLLDVEAELERRQAELEGLLSERRLIGNQVSLATIDVSISTKTSVEPSGFTGGLNRGWNGLVAVANALLTAAGVLLPWLIPLAAIAWLVRRLAFRAR